MKTHAWLSTSPQNESDTQPDNATTVRKHSTDKIISDLADRFAHSSKV